MDPIHGSDPWIKTMDQIHGSDPKGSQGSPKNGPKETPRVPKESKKGPKESPASPKGSHETPRHFARKTSKLAEAFDKNWSERPQDSTASTIFFENA